VAIQQGQWLAKAIRHDLRNEPRGSFHYLDKGSLATIGRAAAVADLGRLKLSGYFAWLAWLFVHILYLIGFRNRLLVMVQWAWSYLTYDRGARLITGSNELPGWKDGSDVREVSAKQEPTIGNFAQKR
jgi:NADH dehydrogenase